MLWSVVENSLEISAAWSHSGEIRWLDAWWCWLPFAHGEFQARCEELQQTSKTTEEAVYIVPGYGRSSSSEYSAGSQPLVSDHVIFSNFHFTIWCTISWDIQHVAWKLPCLWALDATQWMPSVFDGLPKKVIRHWLDIGQIVVLFVIFTDHNERLANQYYIILESLIIRMWIILVSVSVTQHIKV